MRRRNPLTGLGTVLVLGLAALLVLGAVSYLVGKITERRRADAAQDRVCWALIVARTSPELRRGLVRPAFPCNEIDRDELRQWPRTRARANR